MEFSYLRHPTTLYYLGEQPEREGVLTWTPAVERALLFRFQKQESLPTNLQAIGDNNEFDLSYQTTITTVYGGERPFVFSSQKKDEEVQYTLLPFSQVLETDGSRSDVRPYYQILVTATHQEEERYATYTASVHSFIDSRQTSRIPLLGLSEGVVDIIPLRSKTPDYTITTWQAMERFSPENTQSECQLLLAGYFSRSTELTPLTFARGDCANGSLQVSLEVGQTRLLSLTNFQSLIVPENITVTFYDAIDTPEGGSAKTYGPGIYQFPGNGVTAFSAIVRRILPYALYQVSLCGGYARLQTKTSGYRPQSTACDTAVTTLCQVNKNQLSVCNCLREQKDLTLKLEGLGLADLVKNLPVKCFGKDCFVEGYVTAQMATTECNSTVCVQSQQQIGASINALGNTQTLVCNGQDFYKDGKFVQSVPPPPTSDSETQNVRVSNFPNGVLRTSTALISASVFLLLLIGSLLLIAWYLRNKMAVSR